MIDIRQCDNLELMSEIKDNTVDLIYCDVLYGTGRNFGDYQDLKPEREIIEEHYIPRLKEMYRILKDTGSIYLQMDTKINHWIRCIMDDIFGYDNFKNSIVWNYVNTPNFTQKKYRRGYDVILYYTKSKTWTFNQLYNDISQRKLELIENGYNTKRLNGKLYLYVYNLELCKQKQINFNNYDIVKYIDVSVGSKLNEIWSISSINSNASERNGYPTQKLKVLLERIIKASSNEGDLVADFYGGSFTTAEVCKELNRNFIGCDISERAVKIGLERIKKVSTNEIIINNNISNDLYL